MNSFKILLIIGFILLVLPYTDAQVVLQIERFNNPIVQKYYEGQYIEYKTKEYNDFWYKDRIVEIKDKEQLLIFDNGLISIDDIVMLREPKPVMRYISNGLYGFGANWFLWGGIATLRKTFDPGWDTVAIGGFAFLGGWFFRKFNYKTTKINKRTKLRIIDISWPDPIK